MGRPAKSFALHKVHGTTSQADPSVSVIPGVSRIKCPKGVTGEARRVFKQLCQQLAERSALTDGDQSLLTLYSAVWTRWRKAQDQLESKGSVVTVISYTKNGDPIEREKISPHWQIAQACEKQLLAILVQLGLTPTCREKVKPTSGSGHKEVIPGSMIDLHPEWYEQKVTAIRNPETEKQ